MRLPLSQSRAPWPRRFGIHSRIATIAVALTVKTVLLSLLIHASLTEPVGVAATIDDIQH